MRISDVDASPEERRSKGCAPNAKVGAVEAAQTDGSQLNDRSNN